MFEVMKMPKEQFTIIRDFSNRCQQVAILTNARRSMDDLSYRISSLDRFSHEKVPHFRDVSRSASSLYQKTKVRFDISVKRARSMNQSERMTRRNELRYPLSRINNDIRSEAETTTHCTSHPELDDDRWAKGIFRGYRSLAA